MSIKIEKNIPIPGFSTGVGRPERYPFRDMKNGDSFAVPYSKAAAAALITCAKRFKVKVTTRALIEDGVKVVRVWRIEPAESKKEAPKEATHPLFDLSLRVPDIGTEGFISIKDAAEYLDISTRTAMRHTKSGLIPSVKIGRRRLISKSMLVGVAQ